MATHDNFLRAILAHPEDDTVRLHYADWLEEQGQAERAEFIRVQCELARLPPARKQLRDCNVYVLPPDYFDVTGRESLIKAPTRAEGTAHVAAGEVSRGEEVDVIFRDGSYLEGMVVVDVLPLGDGQSVAAARLESGGSVDAHRRRRGELKNRERKLLEANHYFLRDFSGLNVPWPDIRPTFRRGFLEGVSLRCVHWLKHGPALVRRTPLRSVRLTDIGGPRPGGWFHEERQGFQWPRFGGSPLGGMPLNSAFGTTEVVIAVEAQLALAEALRYETEHRWFDSEEEAGKAVSDVCLSWAREQSLEKSPAR